MLNVDRTITRLALCGLVLVAGCASNDRPRTEQVDSKADARVKPVDSAPSTTFPRISLEAGTQTTLGDAFRYIGETYGGGAVLSAGLEIVPTPAQGVGEMGFVAGLKKLAEPNNCRLQVTPHYVFVYQEGYEQLETLTVTGKVAPRFESTRASFAIGAGTDMFNALALLSSSVEMTIIADQIVAEAWCGEVFLEDAPVSAIVEALLKAALFSPALIEVESGEDYIFVRSSANQSSSPTCLNAEQLTAEQKAVLAAPVSFRLPDTGPKLAFQGKSTTLAENLPALSRALGIPVTATEELGRMPVNISVFQHIPASTALDLLVRQWLLPRYGYRMENGGLHFCAR